ncbi:hypothetical protein, partial [Bacteroides fragilis]|uniref:hypothetical protein n=1 Tax=Bacteroides fragilis TaxID=817 RepID=UPI001D01CCF0
IEVSRERMSPSAKETKTCSGLSQPFFGTISKCQVSFGTVQRTSMASERRELQDCAMETCSQVTEEIFQNS